MKWDDNDSEFLTTTNNAVWLKKFKFVLWHLCNCANIIFEFTNLCITTYLWIRIKPILHAGSVTLHRQLFSNEKQGATMCFSCLALKQHFPCKNPKLQHFCREKPNLRRFCHEKPNLRHFCHNLSRNVKTNRTKIFSPDLCCTKVPQIVPACFSQ